MDEKTLLEAIGKMMDEKLAEHSQITNTKFREQTEEIVSYVEARLDEQTLRIEAKIENSVTQRINALFDGYKLTHEKQWELERQNEALKALIDDLQRRVSVLESKTA